MMSDIVIRFFEIIGIMVECPESKRDLQWRIRFFEKEVDSIPETDPLFNAAQIMKQEIAICQRRRRSRRYYYNAAMIDWLWGSYMTSRSPMVLTQAWNAFCAESYKISA